MPSSKLLGTVHNLWVGGGGGGYGYFFLIFFFSPDDVSVVYFVNFSLAGISLLLIGNVVLTSNR